MINLFIVILLVPLLVINFVLGWFLAIRLGYGPPHWITALNLVVRVTTLQDWLNEWRTRLEQKAPWTEKIFTRLHVPKPIILVDVSAVDVLEEEEESIPTEGADEIATAEPMDESEYELAASLILEAQKTTHGQEHAV